MRVPERCAVGQGRFAAAGRRLAIGVPAGLYVLVAPVLIALVSGIVSAWLLLTKLTE